jgi:hypothetical protein
MKKTVFTGKFKSKFKDRLVTIEYLLSFENSFFGSKWVITYYLPNGDSFRYHWLSFGYKDKPKKEVIVQIYLENV